MSSRPILTALSLAATLAPGVALACTPAPGYSVPTNLELAEEANLVLVGEVVGEQIGSADDPASAAVTVRPVTAMKGLVPGADIRLGGMQISGPGAPQTSGDPLAFDEAHPAAYSGACIRREFAAGAQVLFFLERRDGEWVPAGGPFSRWAEDVTGEDDPWAQLALLYTHASLMPDAEAQAMLQDQYDALLARPDEPVAMAMAQDIERSLAGPRAPLVQPLPPAPEAAEEEREIEPPPAVAQVADSPSPPAEDGLSDVQSAIDAFGADD